MTTSGIFGFFGCTLPFLSCLKKLERKSNGLPALEDDSSAAMKRGVSLSLSLVDCLGAISAWFPDDGANAFDPSIEF